MSQYGPAATLLGVHRAARDRGYFVSMANLSGVTPEANTDALEHLPQQAVEGTLVIVPHSTCSNDCAVSRSRIRWSPSGSTVATD